MEPTAKKAKRSELSPSKELELLDLNDDCICDILWKLSPADLCSMSFTCHRMQELAFGHFPRQYPGERIVVRRDLVNNEPHIYIEDKSKNYRKYLSKCIRNVRIESEGTHEPLQDLFDFVNNECSAVLRSLQLDIEGWLKSANVRVIENRLENLLKLSVRTPHCRVDIHELLLKHCRKIEKFQIWTRDHFDAFWMVHKYPTIKTVHMDIDTEYLKMDFDQLVKIFFQLNPQIKNVSSSGSQLTTAIWRHHHNNIEQMQVQVHHDLLAMLSELQDFNKEGRFRWLDIHMTGDMNRDDYKNLIKINGLQPIRCLHTYLCEIPDELTFVSSLKSLVQLIVYFHSGYSQLHKALSVLSRQLPGLQHVELNVGSALWIFKDVVMPFARNSLNMRNLSLPHCSPNNFLFHSNDAVELNDVRLKIAGAHPMTVRIGYQECFERPPFNYPAAKSVVSVIFTTNDDSKLRICKNSF